jgi:citronellyl-CoA dehydrogenase
MNLTQEHEALRSTIRKWIDTEVNPHVDEWEAAGIMPAHDLFKSAAALGLLGIDKPEEFGGMGLDYSFAAILAEELGYIRAGGVPMALGVQTDMATPALARHGSDALRAEYLAAAIAGEQVACLGVSEVGSGSDVASLKTTAQVDGDDYIINGGKMWTTNGTQADFCCLLANTSDGAVHRNKSLIIMPMDAKGIEVARKIDKVGMRSSDTAQLYFDNVRVPRRNLIGQENMGFIYQMEQFQYERLWAGFSTIGSLQRAIDGTIEYTRDRKAFGKALLDNQYIQFKLAEYQAELDLLQAACWQAAEVICNGEDATRLATVCKLKAGRLAREVADGCLQFWGGMGFTEEVDISRIWRDGRLSSIGGGADEVMLQILSKLMGIHS